MDSSSDMTASLGRLALDAGARLPGVGGTAEEEEDERVRTVYLGNVPAGTLVHDLVSQLHHGPIESIKPLPDRNCVFVSFLDAQTAEACHEQLRTEPILLQGQELKVGFGKPSPVPQHILQAVTGLDASRHVLLANLTEHQCRLDEVKTMTGQFGPLDQVRVSNDERTASVHFLSISSAVKCLGCLSSELGWSEVKMAYGTDRCQVDNAEQEGMTAGVTAPYDASTWTSTPSRLSKKAASGGTPFQSSPFGTPFTPSAEMFPDAFEENMTPLMQSSPMLGLSPLHTPMMLAAAAAAAAGHHSNLGNRTVYLGSIHSETTLEELCNAIRGGILHSIRYLKDKHIAFVTFVEPGAAATFYNLATFQGIVIHNRRLKVGWGKHSGPLPTAIALAVQNGVTRNVYIGNITDSEFDEERLRQDFEEFGEIELINSLPSKSCSFVNFCNISSALKAAEGIRKNPAYKSLKIANGKDRCANPPRGLNGTTAHVMGMSPMLGMGVSPMAMGMMGMGMSAPSSPLFTGGSGEHVDVDATSPIPFPSMYHHQQQHHARSPLAYPRDGHGLGLDMGS